MISVVSGLSLALCVATALLWFLSYASPWTADLGAPRHNGSTERSTDWAWHLVSRDGAFDVAPANSFYSWHTQYWKLLVLFAALPAWRTVERLPQLRADFRR